MRDLIARDDEQLRRLESTIAAFRKRSAAEQSKGGALLAALEAERDEVLRYCPRARGRQRVAATWH